MCGLVAIMVPTSVKIDRDIFGEGVSSLLHRGPDASSVNYFPEHGVALGHTRLSIVDPSPRSDQPFSTKRVTLVFNGEIYNHKELRAELATNGAQFITSGDTEVIARGFEYWGVSIFDRLEGMYSIVLLDRESGTLFITRDLFGIKPLYVLPELNGSIAFASEVKALQSVRSLTIHEDTLFDFLTWGFQISHRSFFEKVSHFPPGAVMSLARDTDGGIKSVVTNRHRLRATYERRRDRNVNLRSILEDSVRDHLIADVPVAIALSGGLDSSIIAALAAQKSQELTAFTLTLTEAEDEEVRHAAKVSRKVGLTHRIVRMEITDFEALLGKIAYHLEEPVANINVVLTYGLAMAIRQAGFKVILFGEGADEIFAGYPWYAFSRDSELCANPDLIYAAYHKRRSQKSLNRILTSEAQERLSRREKEQIATFVDEWRALPLSVSCLNRFLYFDQVYQLQFSQLLRIDRMTMAHGVEARVPFLYERVAQAGASLKDSEKIPLHWYQRFGRTEKIGLARAAGNILPRETRMRPKSGPLGTVNIWGTSVLQQVSATFGVVLKSPRYALAREHLGRIIEWKNLDVDKITPKKKFMLMLTLMCTHIHVCGLDMPQSSQPIILHEI